jgi:hypothetical protein
MRPWPILAAALLLTGCAARMTELQAQWDAADDKTCLGSGIERGSDAYVACRKKLATEYRPFRVNSNFQ